MAGETILELLVKAGVLDDRQHDNVMSRAKGATGGHLVQQVADMGYATESTVARVLSVELGLPRIDLHATPAEADALTLLEPRTCIEKFILPVALRESGELLWLAMGDPTDSTTMAQVRRTTGKRVRPVVAGPTEIVREARRIFSAPRVADDEEQEFERDPAASPIELGVQGEESFEIVNITDDSAGPTLAFASSPGSKASAELSPSDPPPLASTPPPPPPAELSSEPPLELETLLNVPARTTGVVQNDLTPEDVASLEAVRVSMEKGALVLRALAELCVEKGLFTREEMGRRARTDSQRGITSPGTRPGTSPGRK